MYNKEKMMKDLKVTEDKDTDGSDILAIEIKTLNGIREVYLPKLMMDGNEWKMLFPKYFDKRILTIKFLKSLIK
jgi:hypothetical protein